MDDETLNTTIRRFLKEFGVSGHQAVDAAIRGAVADGSVKEGQTVAVSATLTVETINFAHTVDGALSTKSD